MSQRLDQLPPGQVGAYLKSRGWRLLDRSESAAKWTLPETARGRSVVVLTNALDPEYEDFLRIVLARLRDVERRNPELIVADIMNAGRDALTISVTAPVIASGEIPLAYGEELFGGVRDLIAAGGRSVAVTRANFLGPTPADVMDVLERLTFGETRAGSYILTVKTPVDQQLAFEAAPSALAFERRALARTLEAVSAARVAGAHIDDEDVIDESIERGMSAQLCRALARMDPATTGVTVKLKAQWAPGLPIPGDAPSDVELHTDDLAHVRAIGDALAKLTPETDFYLSGWIKTVSYDALFESHGVVVVEGRVKGRRRDIRLELEGPALDEAQRLLGRGHISARGTLEKAGRAWVLADPVGLSFDEGTPTDYDMSE